MNSYKKEVNFVQGKSVAYKTAIFCKKNSIVNIRLKLQVNLSYSHGLSYSS